MAKEEALKSHGIVFVVDIKDLEDLGNGIYKLDKDHRILEE